jgi:hypothetical protein
MNIKIEEVLALQSIFCQDNELLFSSQTQALVHQYTVGNHSLRAETIEFDVSLQVETVCLMVNVKLPEEYPLASPLVRLSSAEMVRSEMDLLYSTLGTLVSENKGDTCIYAILEGLRYKLTDMLAKRMRVSKPNIIPTVSAPLKFVREILWFHHIYSKHKKRGNEYFFHQMSGIGNYLVL